MGSQDNLEKVLRDIRVLLADSRTYEKDEDSVIVNKKQAYELLQRFNLVLEDIKEDYELTKQSREQAERDARHTGEYIIKNANLKAEDVYAASVLYTDDALSRIQDIMKQANDAVAGTMKEFTEQMKRNQEVVRDNQSELKVQLRDMTDTKKYLNLIEEINKKREKERLWKEQAGADEKKKAIQNEGSIYAAPEIHINREYFEQNGIPIEEEEAPKEPEVKAAAPEISVNLDSEYFKWKNGESAEESPKPQKKSKLFSFGKK